ncbi:MAG: 16S rRNA (cytidine(1402)-2'-O)-methyltransferase [Alphaproteobacteria bacterium]|nr:16S rRNA (cytidine(1402)-2'-O)-methyltransferase [Alphaproteobacteria bacterium]
MAGGKTVHEVTPLAPGLYLVATPIGAARDITLRALDVLASADVLAAEDTRTLRHLMEIHGIALGNRPLVACHDHNEAQTSPRLVQAIAEGKSVAYASEAGTPMVSDPGFPLARAVIAVGQKVTAAPGPSAALCALMVAGLPTDRFVFAGFPPSQKSARRSFLQELAAIEATLVLYESPKRINQMLQDCCEILGDGRTMALCRELTKRFEEVIRGSLAEVRQAIADRDLKGEIVLVIGRGAAVAVDAATIGAALYRALEEMSVKDAAAAVAEAFDLPRREVYQMALQRTKP